MNTSTAQGDHPLAGDFSREHGPLACLLLQPAALIN